jgi:hypothetical protein
MAQVIPTVIFTKMDWATFWAIFFTSTSGHPDRLVPDAEEVVDEAEAAAAAAAAAALS